MSNLDQRRDAGQILKKFLNHEVIFVPACYYIDFLTQKKSGFKGKLVKFSRQIKWGDNAFWITLQVTHEKEYTHEEVYPYFPDSGDVILTPLEPLISNPMTLDVSKPIPIPNTTKLSG